MYTSADLRKGLKIEIDNQPWAVTEFDFCKPGKGQALYRCKLKNMLTNVTMDKTFRPNDRIDKPTIEERECIYLYNEGPKYVFSDNETYEEIYVNDLSALLAANRRHKFPRTFLVTMKHTRKFMSTIRC